MSSDCSRSRRVTSSTSSRRCVAQGGVGPTRRPAASRAESRRNSQHPRLTSRVPSSSLSPPVAARFRRARLVLRENHAVQGHHPVHRHRQIGVHRQEGVPDARLHRHAFHVARSRRRASRRHRRPLPRRHPGHALQIRRDRGTRHAPPLRQGEGCLRRSRHRRARLHPWQARRHVRSRAQRPASSPLSTTPPARPHDSRHRPRTPPFRCSSGIPARCI